MTGRATARKFRLFACACCRRIWDLLDAPSREAVLLAERWADESIPDDEAEAARRRMYAHRTEVTLTPGRPAIHSWACGAAEGTLFEVPVWHPNAPEQGAVGVARTAAEAACRRGGHATRVHEATHQLGLFRDMFENPYRPGWIDPAALTLDVTGLARGIYEDRAFDRMPVLADALMDAGCDQDDILTHCRGDGPHVRGCWVVDLVLGKE
jgi:hypothetical protein